MAEVEEFRCFVGGLSWDTSEKTLMEEFRSYQITEAKVIQDPETGRSRGFGFVTFAEKRDMDDAIQGMHGKEIDGRTITVDVAQPRGSGGPRRGGGGDRREGGGRGGGGGECFKCGEMGHWARDCPTGGGDRYGSRGGSRSYGGGGDRYGSDRGGGGSYDRYGDGRSGGAYRGGEGRGERSAPYERRSSRDYRDRDSREPREGGGRDDRDERD